VPIVVFHNRVDLPVQVEEKTNEMVLDTGAAISGLSEETANALRLPVSGTAKVTGNGEACPKIELAKTLYFSFALYESEPGLHHLPFITCSC